MIRHIGQRDRDASVAAVEERMHVLEGRVAALADALRVLARGLEDPPTSEPGGKRIADAARQAYDLLLVAEPRPQGEQGAGHPGP